MRPVASALVAKPQIRRAGPEALSIAQAIHDAYYVQSGTYAPVFSEYVAASIEAFRTGWDDRTDRIWLAESDGVLVGYVAACHTDGDDLQLRYLYVDPAGRGHGLGRHLVQTVIDHARDVGASGLRLWTMDNQTVARALYESFGWTLTETAPAPWHDTFLQQRFDLRF